MVITKNNRKSWCKCLGTLAHFPKEVIHKIYETLEPSTSSFTSSQWNSMFHEVYPPNPRPRPRPNAPFASTVAFASRSRWTMESWPLTAAKCSGVSPQEPQPEAKPRAEPNRTKGRKSLRKFWAPQKSKFWKFWTLKILPGLTEQCGFEDVLMTSSWLKKAM